MQNNSNKKYSIGTIPALLASLLLTAVVGYFIFANENMSWFLDNIDWGWLYIGSLLLVFFIGIYWQFSGGYWRLRDKMVYAMPGKNWYSKAGLLVLIFMVLGAVAGIMSVAFLY